MEIIQELAGRVDNGLAGNRLICLKMVRMARDKHVDRKLGISQNLLQKGPEGQVVRRKRPACNKYTVGKEVSG